MNNTERIEYAAQRKKEMNCCQAVLVAFAGELGMDEEKLLKAGSGFGSGFVTTEGTCGALVGAVMVSSLLAAKGEERNASRAIFERFKALCGATACRDIKGIDSGKPLCSCEDCVKNAVLAAVEVLDFK